MVGTIMLIKLLHKKRSGLLKCNRKVSNEISNNADVDVKIEHNESQDTCRVCLKEGTIPIYGSVGTNDISAELASIVGIEISFDDELPKNICLNCYTTLQNAISLRKTAQKSDQILRQPEQSDDDTGMDYDTLDNEYVSESPEKKQNTYYCKRCNLEFKTYTEYEEHRLSEEHENVRHECPICQKTYSTMYFKKHMSLHKKDISYMCDICGKKFMVRHQFSRHRLTHFYDLPFKCSLCPYRGRFTESLKMHMRSHTGEKPYQCTECPSRFINKSNLNKHLLTHKGGHDFKCNFCGRGYYTKRDLELHFKVEHTGIKDHFCDICGKAFGYRKQMMKHQLKVHKREKLRSGRMPLYLQVDSGKVQPDEMDPK